MILQRVSLVIAACLALFTSACTGGDVSATEHAASSGDWRQGIKKLRMGSKASEEDPIAMRRSELIQSYLTDATGLPVKVYQGSDYNGIIQAMASGQIDIATMGAGSYANVHAQIGDDAEPLLVRRDTNGESGYYSTIVVRADSPYQSIHDLKGKSLAYVDFNSTSGYIFPRWSMRQQGIEPDDYFGDVVLAGGHIQSIMALQNGQFEATVVSANGGNPETGFGNGTIARLARRGMIDPDEYRMIWSAGPIPNSPYVVRSALPQELRDLLRGAIAAMPYDAPEAQAGMAQLPGADYRAISDDFFEEIFEMREREISQHRVRATSGGWR